MLTHTGTDRTLVERLLRLLRERFGPRAVAFLDTDRVTARQRKGWIDREVVGRGVQVLLANPLAIQTGLNNLVCFATAILYQNPHADAIVYRQAFGRIDRPGQRLPTKMVVPYYPDTVQAAAHELLGRKVTASMQVDGIDIASALDAVGAGDAAGTDALSFGQAIYALLLQEREEGRTRGPSAWDGPALLGDATLGLAAGLAGPAGPRDTAPAPEAAAAGAAATSVEPTRVLALAEAATAVATVAARQPALPLDLLWGDQAGEGATAPADPASDAPLVVASEGLAASEAFEAAATPRGVRQARPLASRQLTLFE